MPPPTAGPQRGAGSGARARAALVAIVALLVIAAAAPTAAAADRPPKLDARAWILVDARDGSRLAAEAPSQPLPVASATKLMTAYLALRDLGLDETVAAPAYSPAPAESVLGLREGEEISARDLLVAMMLPSANDAAVALATEVSGSVPRFVRRMNRAADRLELDDSSFANPIGLDDPRNRMSAGDLAELTLALREDERFRKIVAKQEASLRSGAGRRRVSSRNALLEADASVDGVKTGHTLGAGYVLVASAEREGVPLVSVVLGAPSEATRDAETARLLDYGFSLYEPRRAIRRGETLGTVPVAGEDEPLSLEAAGGLEVTARADQTPQTRLLTPAEVDGPIERGERLGRAVVKLGGERVGAVPLVAARAVAEPGVLDGAGGPLAALLVAGGLILIVAAVVLASRRSRASGARPERSPEERMASHRRRIRQKQAEGEKL